jgi:murein L,D-transpeptidase YcbB/YkuD
MSDPVENSRRRFIAAASAFGAVSWLGLPLSARAGAGLFRQAVAEAAAGDRELAAFYRENGHAPVWTGRGGRARARRQALLRALEGAGEHGLPAGRYDTGLLRRNLRTVRSERELGRLEVELSRLFLRYARDIQSGILEPSKVDHEIARKRPLRDGAVTLANFTRSSPAAYLRQLPPQTAEYARLMKHKLKLERVLARGGWGPKVPARKLQPGDSGAEVVALRNRLIAMGFMRRTASASYDERLTAAVRRFQAAHGLAADGIAGKSTLAELNVPPERRLAAIIVAMERERWLNLPRGNPYIWVNIPDFRVRMFENGKVIYESVSVVGKNSPDRRTPEFSDQMEYMVINPSWYVPRSIAVKEYLPMLKRDPDAVRQLELRASDGQVVPRSVVDFSQYDASNFPFSLREPPSQGNALGLVKFMLPNRFNIYLHDTPAKSLFRYEKRDFSHGCIRLQKPFEFAYVLLARQTADPKEFFQSRLRTGEETQVDLVRPIPVHIVYRTAFTTAGGDIEFRRDVYGRDARIFAALQEAGVALRAHRG